MTKATNQARLLPASPGATNAVVAQDIRDIKPPLPIPSSWAWVAWALTAAALLALAYWGWRRWKARQPQPAPAPALSPHERACQKLRQALDLLDQPKPFCIAVSDILRSYLEERFDFRAPERTTEEFLDELQGSPKLSFEQKQILGDFLLRCDLVKFARYEPGRPELQDLYDAALRLVEETAPTAEAGPALAPTGAAGASAARPEA
jgi:hypothetical protein